MCTLVMTEELTHARFETDNTFVDPSCMINNGVYDLERFRLLADRIKPFLGPCLEKRIHSGLEEFVCKSSSRYSRQFPRVKRCLDAVAAWLNYLDAFRTKDIEEETIKHAIEYLLKGGRVTHLEDPVVLNTGINRVDMDSLTEQTAMKNRNVWSFIKEKDYWLCQDQERTTSTCKPPPTINPQLQECKKENSSSDLDVEIGSSKRELLNKVTCNKIFNKYTCCKQQIETKGQCDQEMIFCPKQNTVNLSHEASVTINEPKPLQTRRNLRKSSTKIPCDLQISCCSKQNNLNSSEEASTIINEPKPLQTRRNLRKSSTNIPCDLQITSCSKQNSMNPSNEASITTNDPKLLQTRRNIPNPSTKIPSNCNQNCDQNLCPKSPKLKLVIHKTTNTNRCTLWKSPKVSSLSVPCKSSHLIVRLFEADPSLSDSCLILMKRKFEHDIRNACSCLNDIFKKVDNSTMKRLCLNCQIHPGRIDLNLQRDDGSSKVRLFLARVPICLNVHKRESSCRNIKFEESQDSNRNLDYCYREEFQERQIAFYSQCSNHDLMEEKRSSKDIMGKEVNFVWSKKKAKEVDFVLSSSFTRSKANEDLEENFIPCTKRDCIKVCEEEDLEKTNTCANSSVTEDDNQRKLDDICSFSSSSSIEQDNSTVGVCDPEQCSCRVLCTNNDNSELENNIKEKECVAQSQNIIEKKDNRLKNCPEAEEDISKKKSNDLRVQDFSKLERNIVTVRSSTLQIQKLLITTEISETEKNSEKKETCSIDYISSTISKNNSKISCDSKCSRCGKDLSEEESKNIIKSFDTETRRTLNSVSTRNMNLKEPTKTPSISSMKATNRTFVMKNENLSTECSGNCNKNLINNERDSEVIEESCKCPSNSSTRTNMNTQNFLEKNFNSKSTKFRSKFSKKRCRSSSTSKTRCQAQEDISYLSSRRKNSFWKKSIVPGSFCSSFPALDRIKYLIRKKLRRLLLEERDKGTSTSKTYLKNDRYLVSISSGKLNEERICSSIRCPFTTRNQVENQSLQTTFTEGSSLTKNKKKDTFEDGVRGRCRKMIQDNEVFRKIRLNEISRFLGQKSGSKMNNHQMIDENEQCPFYRDGRQKKRSSMESFGSTRVIFFDDLDQTKRKNRRKFSKGILKEGITSPNFISKRNFHRRGREGGDALRDERPRSFEKRLFKCCKIEDHDADNDFMNLLGSYERRISDLDADFRLKLLQYVALCRSVKDLLMKRLPRPDDVYEGSSSSM